MDRERWQLVERIYHAALEREVEARAAFLSEACADDRDLRHEVEALIAEDGQAGSFIESPALEIAAKQMAGDSFSQEESAAPERIGPYKLLAQLGRGGMGEVHLALDTRLNRKVAIKLLPDEYTTDPLRVRRFEQEARAASALNHPNILTIYEIGQHDSLHFIATEFIEGETLRQRMASASQTLQTVLDIATQIASALAAAHAAGLIHRDIKPENIMVRPDGLVKVLDFGLAKLTEKTSTVDTTAPTALNAHTDPGTVMGTAQYMSPEQARGETLDARSDIFSFGAVLYEMVSGRHPFAEASPAATLSAILTREPAPLARYVSVVPDELQRIVRKALSKSKEARYQGIKDLLIDLRELRQDLEFEAKLQRSIGSGVRDGAPKTERAESGGPAEAQTGPSNTVSTGETLEPRTTSRTRIVIGEINRHRLGVSLTLVALMIAGVGYALFFRGAPAKPQPEIKSLAVLPLKSLDAGENYLGLGIADAVIRRISQTGELTVRPTSAVRRYLNEDTDALTAARQLNADAVLEGSVQRADERLRVSVNLLRVSDGASLWADNFDMRMTDIFTIQDTVAQQLAGHLRVQLDPSQQARLTKRYTSNPIAYEYYVKGVYSFDQRGGPLDRPQGEATIDFFKKAIDADPNFALAHAQLAHAYAWKALFIEPTEPVWAERAREEINRAQALDPQLAEPHVARHLLLWSAYEGFQNEAAVRELLLATQLNPNIGHADLASLYQHIGLEDLAQRELQRALEIDPTSEFAKGQILNLYFMGGKYDEWLAAYQKLYPGNPLTPYTAWYLMGKGRLQEAQKTLEEVSAKEPNNAYLPQSKAVLFALKEDFRAVEAEIPSILSKYPRTDPNHHHAAYDIACVYSLAGKSDEAVKWLREAAATGFPCYPLFERDGHLNRIRQAPEFIEFMAEMKTHWEGYRREFGEGATR